MRKLDSDTKRIIELYKYDKEKKIEELIIKRKEEIRDVVERYVRDIESEYIFFQSAIDVINKEYNGVVKISYRFEVSNYASDYYPLYDEDPVLRGLNDSLTVIKVERKNIMLALQFADSKSKEYKEALKKLREDN